MEEICIFRVQHVGNMWRVMESVNKDDAGRRQYRIIHNRRVYERFSRTNGQRAVELCLRYALDCDIDISWRGVL